jgi:hypothetical protein
MPSKSSKSLKKRCEVWVWEPLTVEVGKGQPQPVKKGQRKYGKPQDNQSKLQEKKDNGKMKKYIEKWCDFHKSP